MTLPGDPHVSSIPIDLKICTVIVPEDLPVAAQLSRMNLIPALGVCYVDCSMLTLITALGKLQEAPALRW